MVSVGPKILISQLPKEVQKTAKAYDKDKNNELSMNEMDQNQDGYLDLDPVIKNRVALADYNPLQSALFQKNVFTKPVVPSHMKPNVERYMGGHTRSIQGIDGHEEEIKISEEEKPKVPVDLNKIDYQDKQVVAYYLMETNQDPAMQIEIIKRAQSIATWGLQHIATEEGQLLALNGNKVDFFQ